LIVETIHLADTIKEIFRGFSEAPLTNNLKHYLSYLAKTEQTDDQKIDSISGWYKAERLVLVLGAGSSVAYGLPDWNTLLQKLLLITIKSENTDDLEKGDIDQKAQDDHRASILARTFSNVFEPNSLVTARYLNRYFKKKHPNSKLAFENAIRDVLYSEVSNNDESELLKEIRRFCVAAGRSPNLNSIVTYNYDDILETCLQTIDLDIPFCPIHASGMQHKANQLPIYHVHGYIPRSGQLTSKNKVVLSEDGYHEQYANIYGWSNLTQINKFKDYNCLFIGLSFTDPNLRRLLDISKNERGDDEIHHYCFRKKYEHEVVKNRFKKLLEENEELLDEKQDSELNLDEVVKELIKLMENFEENDALSFGVGIIWIDDYKEIPAYLSNIRSKE